LRRGSFTIGVKSREKQRKRKSNLLISSTITPNRPDSHRDGHNQVARRVNELQGRVKRCGNRIQSLEKILGERSKVKAGERKAGSRRKKKRREPRRRHNKSREVSLND